MKKILILAAATAFLTVITILAASSHTEAAGVYDRIRSKKILRCGVSEGLTGFSLRDASGNWSGIDADFCRSVAAAVGVGVRVEFVPLKTQARFVSLKSGNIDLLCRNTTWTLGREAILDVRFAGVLYFDGQAFMVARKSGINRTEQLKGATICVVKGTTTAMNLLDYSNEKNLNMKPLVLNTHADAKQAFFDGRCKAYTSDSSQLASERLTAPGGGGKYRILPVRISEEPMGPVVARGDEEWLRLARWVLFVLIEAEKHGVTQENAAEMKRTSGNPAVRRLLGAEGGFGRALGTDNDWALRAIQASGNYGEMFERNLGHRSPLQLERGKNRHATVGGLMWAPPFH